MDKFDCIYIFLDSVQRLLSGQCVAVAVRRVCCGCCQDSVQRLLSGLYNGCCQDSVQRLLSGQCVAVVVRAVCSGCCQDSLQRLLTGQCVAVVVRTVCSGCRQDSLQRLLSGQCVAVVVMGADLQVVCDFNIKKSNIFKVIMIPRDRTKCRINTRIQQI